MALPGHVPTQEELGCALWGWELGRLLGMAVRNAIFESNTCVTVEILLWTNEHLVGKDADL